MGLGPWSSVVVLGGAVVVTNSKIGRTGSIALAGAGADGINPSGGPIIACGVAHVPGAGAEAGAEAGAGAGAGTGTGAGVGAGKGAGGVGAGVGQSWYEILLGHESKHCRLEAPESSPGMPKEKEA